MITLAPPAQPASRTEAVCIDMFCGGGGLTEGLIEAAEALNIDLSVIAINHWDTAIATHRLNHPNVKQYCESIEGVDPRELVPAGIVDFLIAAPECVHFSRARGGRPKSPQSRANIYHVLRWCDSLHVKRILIENVREIIDWGPLHPCTCALGPAHLEKHPSPCQFGQPIKEKKGLLFRRFLGDLRARGYAVEFRLLNAAHYGDATSRLRFFLQAVLETEHQPITWPIQTHVAPNELSLFTHAKPWRTAREIIDWSLPGQSIYGRKKPLVFNTHRRIFAGLNRFSGLPKVPFGSEDPLPLFLVRREDAWRLTSFLLPHQHGGDGPGNVRSIDQPLPTVTGQSADMFTVEPYLLGAGGTTGQQRPQPADQPLGTILSNDRRAVVSPCLTEYHSTKGDSERVRSVDTPVPTVDTSNRFGLVQGFLFPVTHRGDSDRTRSLDLPLSTITTAHRGEIAMATPYLIPNFGERKGQQPRTHAVDSPLPAVTSHGAGALVTPYLVKFYGGHDCADIDEPIGAITASYEHYGLGMPYLVVFRNNMAGADIDGPLGTICANAGHFGLARFYLVNYNGTGVPHSCDDPIPTIPTRDRFGLVEPMLSQLKDEDLLMLDILFRMLQPRELANAHSYPTTYIFCGDRDDQVKQVGNSVPICLGRELCLCALGHLRRPAETVAVEAVA